MVDSDMIADDRSTERDEACRCWCPASKWWLELESAEWFVVWNTKQERATAARACNARRRKRNASKGNNFLFTMIIPLIQNR